MFYFLIILTLLEIENIPVHVILLLTVLKDNMHGKKNSDQCLSFITLITMKTILMSIPMDEIEKYIAGVLFTWTCKKTVEHCMFKSMKGFGPTLDVHAARAL